MHLGALDAPDQLTPTYECWTVRREAWLPAFPLSRRYPTTATIPVASNECHCPLAISCCSVVRVSGNTRIAMNLEVGVWLRAPKLSSGTSGLVSG